MKELSYNLKIKIKPFVKVIKLPNDYKKEDEMKMENEFISIN
jgi:hypothetical protein